MGHCKTHLIFVNCYICLAMRKTMEFSSFLFTFQLSVYKVGLLLCCFIYSLVYLAVSLFSLFVFSMHFLFHETSKPGNIFIPEVCSIWKCKIFAPVSFTRYGYGFSSCRLIYDQILAVKDIILHVIWCKYQYKSCWEEIDFPINLQFYLMFIFNYLSL